MAIFYKQGALGRLSREATRGRGKLGAYFESRDLDLLITSIRDGYHSHGTLHWGGDAFDFRRYGYTKKGHYVVVTLDQCRDALGPGWQVMDSRDGATHAEYDPQVRGPGAQEV